MISFHSLEDRMVKQFFKLRSAGNDNNVSRHVPMQASAKLPSFSLLRPAKIRASDTEIARNPKSRSATLRRGIRTAHAAWGAL
jgi:16S rRNA (cytosine1402-N4)-methyltransferase